MKTINIVDIVLVKLQSELLVKGIYTTDNLKYTGGTLVRTNLKVAHKIGEQVTHRNPNSSFYNSNEWDYHSALPLREYCLGFRAIPHFNILGEVVLPSKLS